MSIAEFVRLVTFVNAFLLYLHFMIRVESLVKPVTLHPDQAYSNLFKMYQEFPALPKKVDTKMLVLAEGKHALVLKLYPTTKVILEEQLAAIVIKQPSTPKSEHLASFRVEKVGMVSLSLPSDHVFIENLASKAGDVRNFANKYDYSLPCYLTAWFEAMAKYNNFIESPCLFI